MRRASISEAKNALSALIDRVRHGESVIIEDRGVPVARLESIVTVGADANEGRAARLQRLGVIRPSSEPLPKKFLAAPPPRTKGGATASGVLLAERRSAR